ncbi:hypothetical protein HmCmsJML285_5022 (plasmid) [Escherichia coli]|nr:hypothetical protein HmCmsJML285_5022 [Escherichia coli]
MRLPVQEARLEGGGFPGVVRLAGGHLPGCSRLPVLSFRWSVGFGHFSSPGYLQLWQCRTQ